MIARLRALFRRDTRSLPEQMKALWGTQQTGTVLYATPDKQKLALHAKPRIVRRRA